MYRPSSFFVLCKISIFINLSWSIIFLINVLRPDEKKCSLKVKLTEVDKYNISHKSIFSNFLLNRFKFITALHGRQRTTAITNYFSVFENKKLKIAEYQGEGIAFNFHAVAP